MHFAFITENAPPLICGIGDHSQKFAEALRERGHRTTVLARHGEPADGVEIIDGEIDRRWSGPLGRRLDRIGADHLILQYTPLSFSAGRLRTEHSLLQCWQALGAGRATSLIVHETYFRVWWYPTSLVRGTIQRAALKRLALASRHVFTASELLVDEMSGWCPGRSPVRLPIGSNIPVADADPAALRRQLAIGEEEIVLTLFGGGNSLRWSAHFVDAIDRSLEAAKIAHCWLLLGGVPADWFSLAARVITPPRLASADLSAHLQMTDLFLMPHVAGISAKRGSLIAAMEHGLPVIGTVGAMTDPFWTGVPGVRQAASGDVDGFGEIVLELCADREARRRLGSANADYFRGELTWPRIASKFLDAIAADDERPGSA